MSSAKWCPFCLGLNELTLESWSAPISHTISSEFLIISYLICKNVFKSITGQWNFYKIRFKCVLLDKYYRILSWEALKPYKTEHKHIGLKPCYFSMILWNIILVGLCKRDNYIANALLMHQSYVFCTNLSISDFPVVIGHSLTCSGPENSEPSSKLSISNSTLIAHDISCPINMKCMTVKLGHSLGDNAVTCVMLAHLWCMMAYITSKKWPKTQIVCSPKLFSICRNHVGPVWVQPMRDDITMYCRLSLAEPIPRIIPDLKYDATGY